MDWTTILTSLFGVIFGVGGGVTGLVYHRQNKRLKEAEVKAAEGQNESAAVETLKAAIEEVRDTNRELNEIHDKDTATIEAKNVRINEQSQAIATLSMLVCKHVGCSLREPVYGGGAKWYDNYKADVSLGIDHTPISVLFRQQGDRRKSKGTADHSESESAGEGD